MRNELLNGKGFILFKGFPVEKWGNHKSAVAYMGLGTYLGYFVSQNGLGHVLGHVKVWHLRVLIEVARTIRSGTIRRAMLTDSLGHWRRPNSNRQSSHLSNHC